MAYIPTQQNSTGSFVQQTPLFDVARLYEVEINSAEFRELLVRLAQQTNNLSIDLNTKVSGQNLSQEFVTGKQYQDTSEPNNPNLTKPSWMISINTGALNAGVTNINHGLTIGTTYRFVAIYGAATDIVGFNYYPLPYIDPAGNNISVQVNNTQIIITNNSGITFTGSRIFMEYLKY